jgi:hypothetical protein
MKTYDIQISIKAGNFSFPAEIKKALEKYINSPEFAFEICTDAEAVSISVEQTAEVAL